MISRIINIHTTFKNPFFLRDRADGYCPKFGLLDVDRNTTNLERTKRPSYELFSNIVKSGNVTYLDRYFAWSLVTEAVRQELTHDMCRSDDGETSVDVPFQRKVSSVDWRWTGKPSPNYDYQRYVGSIVLIVLLCVVMLSCFICCCVVCKRRCCPGLCGKKEATEIPKGYSTYGVELQERPLSKFYSS
jgi:hypothetical protein